MSMTSTQNTSWLVTNPTQTSTSLGQSLEQLCRWQLAPDCISTLFYGTVLWQIKWKWSLTAGKEMNETYQDQWRPSFCIQLVNSLNASSKTKRWNEETARHTGRLQQEDLQHPSTQCIRHNPSTEVEHQLKTTKVLRPMVRLRSIIECLPTEPTQVLKILIRFIGV